MKIFTGVLVAALLASSAFADMFQQQATFPSTSIDVSNASHAFLLFSSIGAPAGSTLTGVTLEFQITESLNSLTLTNVSNTPQNARYIASANFDAGDSASAVDGAALDNALLNNGFVLGAAIFNTGLLDFAANQSYTSAFFGIPPSKVLTEDTGVVNGTPSAYAGAGMFGLNYSTLTLFTLIGGNLDVNAAQSATTSATATVIYTYSVPTMVTPEPASVLSLGSVLAAVLFMGHKRLFRHQH